MVVGPRPMRTACQTTHFGPASSAWHHTIESSLASDGKLRWTGSEAATHLHIGVAGPKALHTGRASPQALGTGSPRSPRIGIGGTGRTQDLRSDFLEAGLGAVGIGLITAARHITFLHALREHAGVLRSCTGPNRALPAWIAILPHKPRNALNEAGPAHYTIFGAGRGTALHCERFSFLHQGIDVPMAPLALTTVLLACSARFPGTTYYETPDRNGRAAQCFWATNTVAARQAASTLGARGYRRTAYTPPLSQGQAARPPAQNSSKMGLVQLAYTSSQMPATSFLHFVCADKRAR